MGEDLWCYRAHCMQAKIVHDTAFHGARLATDVLVLVSLPLPLSLMDNRCGTPA